MQYFLWSPGLNRWLEITTEQAAQLMNEGRVKVDNRIFGEARADVAFLFEP
jgi:hypothetical protein